MKEHNGMLCPTCAQTLTDDAQDRVIADDGEETGMFRVAYVVELINRTAALERENAELRWSVIEHEED